MQLIPDTNFLIYLAKFRLLDELENYELVMPRRVVEELLFLTKDKDTSVEDRAGATIALRYLKTKSQKMVRTRGRTDDIIIELAKKHKITIATMDKELSGRAKKQGIKIIKIRQKKYLR